jgi:hypothetical protein
MFSIYSVLRSMSKLANNQEYTETEIYKVNIG